MSRADEIARKTFQKALEATIAPGERRPSSEVQISVIAAALESYAQEERERCVKIAEDVAQLASSRRSWIDPAIISTAELIADGIREER